MKLFELQYAQKYLALIVLIPNNVPEKTFFNFVFATNVLKLYSRTESYQVISSAIKCYFKFSTPITICKNENRRCQTNSHSLHASKKWFLRISPRGSIDITS